MVTRVAVLSCLLCGSLHPATASAEAIEADAALIERVNNEFNLLRSELANLVVDTEPGVAQSVTVPFENESLQLNLCYHSVRSADHYEVKYQEVDGSYTVVDPEPVRTVRGTVEGVDGAVVAGAVDDDGLTALVEMPDGQRWWVEPVASRLRGAPAGQHVIYRDEDALGNGGTCAAAVDGILREIDGGPLPSGGGCNGIPCIAQMGIDTDTEFVARWGNNTAARINLITNLINLQYESQVGIVHEITALILRPDEPDPYSTTNPGGLLTQFQSHWFSNQQEVERDLAQLFSGKNLDGGVIGIAFVSQVCNLVAGYGVVQSLSNTSCASDLSAHELGHIWGSGHCSCPGNTMNPSLTCTNVFSNTSISQIVAHRNSRSCLSDSAPAALFPFQDSFSTSPLDPEMWVANGATVGSLAVNPPSPPSSMRILGTSRPLTGFMDTSAIDRVVLEYWWQRTGLTSSPEPGDDLVVEYHGQNVLWDEIDRQLGDPGGGGDSEPFVRSCVILPEDASFDGLQIRMSIENGDTADTFYIDDFRVADAAQYLRVAEQPETFFCSCLGTDAQFSVGADGIAPFSYQWLLNGNPIPDATDATLAISPIVAGDYGAYSVDVSNECGTMRSEEGQLIQAAEPAVVLPPLGVTKQPGDTLFLNVIAGGVGQCNQFQWLFNGAPIPGAESGFVFVQNMQCANQGCYTVEVTTDCGSVESAIAEVAVDDSCGPVSCVDVVPPFIVHEEGLAGQTSPFSGFIDPRRESDNGIDVNQGLTELTIRFSEPVQAIGGGALSTESFVVTETGDGDAPGIASIDDTEMPLVVVTLDRPITPGEYTTVRAMVQDMAATANVIVNGGDLADLDESDRIDIGFLPGDTNQNKCVNPLDVTRFRQIFNDIFDPSPGREEDYIDINRDGSINPLDLTALRQIVNGTGNATQLWAFTCISDRP